MSARTMFFFLPTYDINSTETNLMLLTSPAYNAFPLTPQHSTLPTSAVLASSPSFGNKAIVLPIGPTRPQDAIVLNGFDKWSGKEVEIGF